MDINLELTKKFECQILSVLSSISGNDPNKEKNILYNLFGSFDYNRTGVIDIDSWFKIIRKLGLNSLNDRDITNLFYIYDVNGSNCINYNEFIQYILFSRDKINFDNIIQQFIQKINSNNGVNYFLLLSQLIKHTNNVLLNLTFDNFIAVFHEAKIDLDDNQLKHIFYKLDREGKGFISINDLLYLISNKNISEERKILIVDKFSKMDLQKFGYVDIQTVKNTFNPKGHPDVVNGIRSEYEVLNEFMLTFDIFLKFKRISGKISYQEFLEYYSIISASINDENYFYEIMEGVWPNDNLNIQNTNYQNNPNINFQNTFNQNKPNINFQNTYNQNQIINIQNTNNNNQNINIQNLDQNFNTENNYNENMNIQNGVNLRIQNPNNNNNKLNEVSINEENNSQMTIDIKEIDPIKRPCKENPQYPIIALRSMLVSKGLNAIFDFENKLSQSDVYNTGKIDKKTFERIISTYNFPHTNECIDVLFSIFDYRNSGIMDYDFLIRALSGNMNERRFYFVKKLYYSLNPDINGNINIDTLKKIFNASKHPEVISRKRRSDDLFKEFFDSIDCLKNYRKSKSLNTLTYEEFLFFYTQISLSYKNDSDFENINLSFWNLK